MPHDSASSQVYAILDGILTIVDAGIPYSYCDDEPFPPSFEDLRDLPDYVLVEEKRRARACMRYIALSGMRHGEAHLFAPKDTHSNETLLWECYFAKDRIHGPSRTYFPCGTLASITWYVHGVKQGRAMRYYSNGNVASEQCYLDGQLHGGQKLYYQSGACRAEFQYAHGALAGTATNYDKRGEPWRIAHWKQNKRHGEDKLYREGALSFSFTYADGKLVEQAKADPIAELYHLQPSK